MVLGLGLRVTSDFWKVWRAVGRLGMKVPCAALDLGSILFEGFYPKP